MKHRGRGKTPGPEVHDDLVQHQFTADGIDRLWYVDISEHPTFGDEVYLCAAKDPASMLIVGLSIVPRITADLACNALRHAIMLRRPLGTHVHRDRGSQFRAKALAIILRQYGLRVSMDRVGAAGGNAATESFFALLQENVLTTWLWNTREELRIAILTRPEGSDHRPRRQAGLGRLTPIEYETISVAALAA